MPAPLIIPRIDIVEDHAWRLVQMERVRRMGPASELAQQHLASGPDALLLMDYEASELGANQLLPLLRELRAQSDVPFWIGGGIHSVADAELFVAQGASRVVVNSAALKNPRFLDDLSRFIGRERVVLHVEARRVGPDYWEAYTANGGDSSDRNVLDWVNEAFGHPVSAILLTSIDRVGTGDGFDLELTRAVAEIAPVPVIACGGFGKVEHLRQLVNDSAAAGMAMAGVLHHEQLGLNEVIDFARHHLDDQPV